MSNVVPYVFVKVLIQQALFKNWRKLVDLQELDIVKQRLIQLKLDVETLKQARQLRIEMEQKILVYQLRKATEMFREAERALDQDINKVYPSLFNK